HPSCKSTKALARRVTRQATDPSRANTINLLRSSSLRKPPARIMRATESAKLENARNFSRLFNESKYSRIPSTAVPVNIRGEISSGQSGLKLGDYAEIKTISQFENIRALI